MRRNIILVFSLIITIIFHPPLQHDARNGNEQNILPDVFTPVNDVKIGFYKGSESEFANAVSYIMKYNSFGPYMQDFYDFANLTSFLFLIIPYSNLSSDDVTKIVAFVEAGGIVYFTGKAPTSLFNVPLVLTQEYTMKTDVGIPGINECCPKNSFLPSTHK
ncbi:MAG: hypothetical protein INQ03_23320 [Candidatus Heimdallarchaeota archaeon]|nr:hypothetical protein [Candidatus Heimdallarchaeota archaeon]